MELIEQFGRALGHEFMQNALVVGVLLGITSSLLGVFLVLRRFSLIGDGLAHVSFATTALALALGFSPLAFNIPLVILGAFAILALSRRVKLHGDAAIGLVSSVAIALGVIISSTGGGFSFDLKSYLFGSILLVDRLDLQLSLVLSVVVVAAIVVFRKDLVSVSYDEDHARVRGIRVERTNAILMVLTAVAIAMGIRIVGTLLVSSLIILPALAALQWARSFRGSLAAAAAISVLAMLGGLVLSFFLRWPSGATVVLLNALVFGLSALAARLRRG